MGEVTNTDVSTQVGEESPDLNGLFGDSDFTLPAIVSPEETTPEAEAPTETEVAETEATQSAGSAASETDTAEEPEATTVVTEMPGGSAIQIGGYTIDAMWLYGALALLVVLLIAVVADTFHKLRNNKKVVKANEETVPASTATAVTTGGVEVKTATLQAQGSRNDQQDAYGISDLSDPTTYARQGVMAVVADGMGGLANGSVVSNLLVRVFLQGFQSGAAYMQPQDLLLDLATRANMQVNQMLRGAERSGSTLVATTIRNGYLHFLTVGDSHLYLYRGGVLLQLNREHVYQEELAVKAVNRYVSVSQVHSDPQAHSLTSYFGIGNIPIIDRNVDGIKLISGDRIILCSDGVYGTLTREQMEQALQKPLDEAANIMGNMIEEAAKPYQDNYTAVILEFQN